MPWWWSSPLKM